MALTLVKTFNVGGDGKYTDIINADNPLSIEQDGSVNDINSISPTTFYVFNDGYRRDPVFDPPTGTVMNLKYTGLTAGTKITISPKPFTTTIKSGTTPSTGTRIYLTEVSKTVPGGNASLSINVGTVLQVASGANTEDVLIKAIGGIGINPYVDVVRNYKGSSSTGSALDLVGGSTVTSSVKHIFMTTNINTWPTNGGGSITLEDLTTALSTPTPNPATTLYQTVYVKAVPQLNNLVATSDPNYVGRIPTQWKTDCYFEVSYRELPL
jgi:hypothetical protein